MRGVESLRCQDDAALCVMDLWYRHRFGGDLPDSRIGQIGQRLGPLDSDWAVCDSAGGNVEAGHGGDGGGLGEVERAEDEK